MAELHPASDVLLGRPLPGVQVADFVRRHANSHAAAARPQWLVDSVGEEAAAMSAEIARAAETPLPRLNLEFDRSRPAPARRPARATAALSAALDVIEAEPRLQLTGLMGYDAQVMGAKSPSAELAKVLERYERA